jgi:hypothetical protein
VNSEKRTTLAILTIAVLSLILAGVFEPRMGVAAKASEPPQYAIEDVSSWLLRFAAWLPAEIPPQHAACRPSAAAQGVTPWGLP